MLGSNSFSKLIASNNSVIKYGSQAKPYFYSLGFIDILKIENTEFKNDVIEKFIKWTKNLKYFDVTKKFVEDQKYLKRFELLIHRDQIPKKIITAENLFEDNLKEFAEGFKTEIITENSFRSQALIKLAKKMLQNPTCIICNFNFEETYGTHGKGFIEMHHIKPISDGKRISKIEDLRPVCSNCHRMLHKGNIILDENHIKEMIKKK